MTSMSFNTIQNQSSISNQQQPLSLREGQVIHATIKQLYPEQMAEVQVGGNKLVAKLETPLKAGDSHFFQVMNTNGQMELKVVTGPMNESSSAQQQLNQLLDSMNLPKSTEMRQILSQFIKNELPLSKEQLLQAEVWMKEMPDQTSKNVAMQAITRMVDLKMPFTNDVFQALINGSKVSGMNDALANLMKNLQQDVTINTSIKATIINQLQVIEKPLQAAIGGTVLALAAQTLTDTSSSLANKLQMLTGLKQADLVSPNATISNWSANLQGTSINGVMQNAGQVVSQIANSQPRSIGQLVQNIQQWVANETTLTQEQKAQLLQLSDRFSQIPATKQTIEIFAKQMSEQLMKAYANNQLTQPSITNHQGLAAKEQLTSLFKQVSTNADQILRQLAQATSQSTNNFLQTTVTEAEQLVQNSLDARSIEHAVKTIVKSLGLNYETVLASAKTEQIDSVAQSLKPQLMNLVQDHQISPQLKDAAEVVLARINGMQLLSTENGHQHQLVMQVPLEFLGKKMDATLQWNGRMKDDGKIDANYARILFYLQMESISETVIDMQVQNRIVIVNVFNENRELNALAEPLKEMLATGLADKDYHLSGVFIKPFEKNEEMATKSAKKEDDAFDGVDIRI